MDDIIGLIDQYGEAGVVFGFVITWIVTWVYFYFTNRSIKEIKDLFEKHEQICEGRHQQFIDYMKNHEGRISHVEGRLNERQQPAT